MTSEIGGSGYYFMLSNNLCRCFSWFSHFVTSKEAFAFCNRYNYFTFSSINSFSFRRFRSLFRLEIEREWGRVLIFEDLDGRGPRADSVERSEWALGYRGRLRLRLLRTGPIPSLEPWLKALPKRSLGARFACVAKVNINRLSKKEQT